jgi:hypothetical protein
MSVVTIIGTGRNVMEPKGNDRKAMRLLSGVKWKVPAIKMPASADMITVTPSPLPEPLRRELGWRVVYYR